jgi:transposase
MGYNIRTYDHNQPFLLPPTLQEWLPDKELAWFVLDVVDQMDLSAFYLRYRHDGQGNALYDPKIMVALLIYAYCLGERSSRKIEQHCLRDISFRVITANQLPDHATIARFRRDNLELIEDLFVEVLRLCVSAGLVKVGVVALDGTKMKANASLAANRTKEQLVEEVKKMLMEAEAHDVEEDARLGSKREEDELPPELWDRKTRLARLRECKARLEAEEAYEQQEYQAKLKLREEKEAESQQKLRGRKPKPPDESPPEQKANATDPDSRIVKSSKGFVQGYNAQAVATEQQIIIAAAVTQQENDVRQLIPMLGLAKFYMVEAGLDAALGTVLGDAGYFSDENLRAKTEAELLIATLKDWKQRKALRDQPPPRGRIPNGMSLRDRMERKLLTKRGRALYKKRGKTIEPIFGQVKDGRGIDRFLLRGVEGADGEWMLICATHNVLKLFRSGKMWVN